MPNANRPSGLSPVKYLGGADWDGKVNIYSIAAADTNAYFPGDPVILSGDGDVNGIAGVTLATAGANPIIGSVVAVGKVARGGPYINASDLTATSRPSGAQTDVYYVAVADDPFIIFEAQEDSIGGALTSADIGRNIALIAGTPATGVKVSAWQIDSSDAGATGSNVKLLGLVQKIGNAFGTNAKWLVLINNHPYKASGTASI
jgi:hypothetical protein